MVSLPPFAAFPALSGATVHLREGGAADLDAWFARASDLESSDLSGDPIPASRDVVAEWLALHQRRCAAGESIRWMIVPAGETDSIGSIGLNRLDAEAGTAEVGMVIGRAHWRRGLGTAAAELVLRFAFDGMGLGEVRADCLERNEGSRRVLAKLGFEAIGEIENYLHGEPGLLFALRRLP